MPPVLRIVLVGMLMGLGTDLSTNAQQIMPRLIKQVGKPAAVNPTTDSMVEDEQGRLWMATDNGVVCYDGHQFRTFHDPLLGQGDSYFHVIASPDGRIWCKPNAGHFLSYIDPNQPRIVRVPDTSTLISQYLPLVGYNYVFADRDANLWIGQQGGLLKVNPRNFAVEPIVRRDKLEVNWITQDRQGKIWFATNQGVYGYDQSSKQVTHYQRDLKHPAMSLGQDKVFSVQARLDGTILVGLNNEIDVIVPATGAVRQIPLPTSTRFGVVPVHEFYLDSAGTAYFRTLLGAAYRYTVDNELQRLELAFPSQAAQLVYPGRKHRLWVDTERTLDQYEQSRMRVIPNLHLIDVVVGGIQLGGPIPDSRFVRDTLGHPTLTIQDTDSLRLRVSPSASAQPAAFRYRLVNHDTNWQLARGSDATVSYQLAAGTYTFVVNRHVPPSGWATSAGTLTVVVKSPFWKTGWFWTLALTLAGGVGGGLLQSWSRRTKLRQELASRAFEAATLRQLDEMKSQFFANITHEFRTPLTLILGPAERLSHKLHDAADRQHLATISRNAMQVLNLVNQLLDLSKLEAGALVVTEVRGNLAQFIEQHVFLFRELAQEKGIALRVDTSELAPLYWFDMDKLDRILTNLIGNALKFTTHGDVVTVEAGAANQGVVLSVTDTGIGIAADQLPHIFDRFYQAGSPPTPNEKQAAATRSVDTPGARIGTAHRLTTFPATTGTGIGLALVNELVQIQGGHIRVTSQLGQGTTFVIELPYRSENLQADGVPVDGANQAQKAEPDSPVILSALSPHPLVSDDKSRVLVVEDNDELAHFILNSLPTECRGIRAANGQLGWEQALVELPDLIISDVMMPVMDGYALCQRLKADRRTSHIPVILLTAKVTLNDRLAGLTRGADDYLTKPFVVVELQLRVRNLIATTRHLRDWVRADLNRPANPSPNLHEPPVALDPFLVKLYDLLDEHLAQPAFGVDDLPPLVGMSRMSLFRKIKAVTGLSPADVIRLHRLKRATELLQSGLSIIETAEQVGFQTVSHFGKVFRDQYQLTPKQYVRQWAS